MRKLVAALFTLAASQPAAFAGIYSAAEPSGMRAGPDGRFVELPYVPPFKAFLDDRLNAANPATPLSVGGLKTFRGQVQDRIDAWKPAGKPSVPDQVAHAVDLIRVGRTADAINLLEPRTRDRTPDYLAIVTLAHAHALHGDWSEATRAHGFALFDATPPAQLPGVLPELTQRYLELEKTYYPRWLKFRQQQVATPENPADQAVLPLFGPTARTPDITPVQWVNAAGQYEPGNLAPDERAKLPADAVAVVQQLLLWAPGDAELLWLLAELYAANGQLREAEAVFDQCTWGRNFTNRKALMDHRAVIRELVALLPPEAAVSIGDEPLDNSDADRAARDAAAWNELRPQLMVAGAVVGAFTLVFLTLAVRTAIRRR